MIKVFEAFAGIGTQRMALRNIGIDFEVVGISEIDKYALISYNAIHGDCPNYGDISKIDPNNLPKIDLFTYSFPCQDISVAGKQEGIIKGKTRSGLLYECEKIIESCKPKYLLMENVKNLIGKKNKSNFEEWLRYLESLGYTNYWDVLNSKNYGVPQNRERVFCISILGEHMPYEFPNPIKLDKNLFDVLESNVDKKYYLSNKCIDKMNRYAPKNLTNTNISPCLTTELSHGTGKNFSPKFCMLINEYRMPTPLEAWRLMGISDEDFYKAQKTGISNTQLYKQAGNSIVVDVLENIFKELFANE